MPVLVVDTPCQIEVLPYVVTDDELFEAVNSKNEKIRNHIAIRLLLNEFVRTLRIFRAEASAEWRNAVAAA